MHCWCSRFALNSLWPFPIAFHSPHMYRVSTFPCIMCVKAFFEQQPFAKIVVQKKNFLDVNAICICRKTTKKKSKTMAIEFRQKWKNHCSLSKSRIWRVRSCANMQFIRWDCGFGKSHFCLQISIFHFGIHSIDFSHFHHFQFFWFFPQKLQ